MKEKYHTHPYGEINPPLMRSPFSILGISSTASLEEVKRAFTERARTLHPDINKHPNAPAQFQEVKEAYDELREHFASGGGYGGPGGGGGEQYGDARFKERAETFRRRQEDYARFYSSQQRGGFGGGAAPPPPPHLRLLYTFLDAFTSPRFLLFAVPLTAYCLFEMSGVGKVAQGEDNDRVVMAYWNKQTGRFEEPVSKHYYSERLFAVKKWRVHPHTPHMEEGRGGGGGGGGGVGKKGPGSPYLK